VTIFPEVRAMRLIVFGSTGGTGIQIVRQARAAGHIAVTPSHRDTNVTDRDSVESALAPGYDVVLSALGTQRLNESTTVYSAGAENILAAMSRAGTRRFITISAIPVGPPPGLLERFIAYPLVYRFFGAAYQDMKRMERIVTASDRDWTIFRPPRLVNRPASGKYRTAIDVPLQNAWQLSRADLAGAMLAAASDSSLTRRIVTIAD
jgi:putative NADH-flavin reductase